ncbi:MAG: tRNA pseudouridine synthase C (EC, partial [uncultured Thiotrichaceae bacterium]
AINKPSGLLVHRSMIDRHETEFALQMTRDQIGQKVYPVHRLDKPTSGVLLFALSSEMAKVLNQQFTEHRVQKKYRAVVRGYTDAEAVIDYPLKFVLDKIADGDAQEDKEAQDAVTAYRTIAQTELPLAVGRYTTSRYSLIECSPKTGRKHQLRRHLKHIFHPIVGDTSYGDGKHNKLFRDEFASHRLLLHAQSLQFIHPKTEETVSIEAPVPSNMGRVLEQIFLDIE